MIQKGRLGAQQKKMINPRGRGRFYIQNFTGHFMQVRS